MGPLGNASSAPRAWNDERLWNTKVCGGVLGLGFSNLPLGYYALQLGASSVRQFVVVGAVHYQLDICFSLEIL